MVNPSLDFPTFDAVVGGYFHQDSIIFGSTLEEVMATCRKDVDLWERQKARDEILRFVEDRPDDAQLKEDWERFDIGTIPEAWGAGPLRQWLLKIAELLVKEEKPGT